MERNNYNRGGGGANAGGGRGAGGRGNGRGVNYHQQYQLDQQYCQNHTGGNGGRGNGRGGNYHQNQQADYQGRGGGGRGTGRGGNYHQNQQPDHQDRSGGDGGRGNGRGGNYHQNQQPDHQDRSGGGGGGRGNVRGGNYHQNQQPDHQDRSGGDGGRGNGRGGNYHQNQQPDHQDHSGGDGGRGNGRGGNYHQNQQPDHQDRSGGGGGGRGNGRGGNSHQNLLPDHQGRGGGGRGNGRGGNYHHNQQPDHQDRSGGGSGRGYGPFQGYGGPQRPPVGMDRQVPTPSNLPLAQQWGPRPVQGEGRGNRSPAISGRGNGTWGRGGTWSGVVARPEAAAPLPPLPRPAVPMVLPLPDVQTLRISEKRSPSPQGSEKDRIVPMRRPDSGGRSAGRVVRLQANFFPIKYNAELTLLRYDVQIEAEKPAEGRFKRRTLKRSDLCLLWDKLYSDNPSQFPKGMAVCDGHSVFSSVKLPTGQFKLELLDGEDTKAGAYIVTIKFVNEYKYSTLNDYLNGIIENNPRDIMQGFELVMKENPSRTGISFGRSTFPFHFKREDDLGCGVAAFRGFQQSLKLTSQRLALVLDTSVLPFRKSILVIDFLMENIPDFRKVSDVNRMRRDVAEALKGLKVTVNHRFTNQKFVVMGLTSKVTRDLSFTCVDREGKVPPKDVKVVAYFEEKYQKVIQYKDIPCLELGNRRDAVPLEFCVIADGQRYPKDKLLGRAKKRLRDISVVLPAERKNTICEIVRSEYGPCGGQVAQNFGFEVDTIMTQVTARVLDPPTVKLGNRFTAKLDQDKCQWNLVQKSLVKGVKIQRWALIDFSSEDMKNKLDQGRFISLLMERCKSLGIHMEKPLVVQTTNMDKLRSVEDVRGCLGETVLQAREKKEERLQLIVCAMAYKHSGYDLLKLVSEIEIGVLTQCLLTENTCKDRYDQFLANLALKINAKVGGSNFELVGPLPGLENEQHVMFIGADVNHPAPMNATSPSIAAVVATVNWPAANQYAARVCPQEHRKEMIVDFGSMCLDLVNTYARINRAKPTKIVVFRDGVSDGQFDMVLNEELCSLKTAIYDGHYKPEITVIVAQKRHQARMFLENDKDGARPFNVPPGTVVDSHITHPFQFDFYLFSHFGGLGTSKSTHYQALWDKHHFSSDELQKLIYDLCFTFVRCTKPVSLVPPVYYADLVAFRGRLYYDAAMELKSRGSTTSSFTRNSSSSSSDSSFDKNFFKVHPNLQDTMFFI